jgi:hypothetical protein
MTDKTTMMPEIEMRAHKARPSDKHQQLNGGDPLADGIADLADVARRSEQRAEARPAPAAMTMADVGTPFAQRGHDLLLESVDKIADDWVHQLKTVRRNSEQLEELVLQRVARVKSNVTQLFLLGNAVTNEAKRGEEVNGKLTEEINKLAEERVE